MTAQEAQMKAQQQQSQAALLMQQQQQQQQQRMGMKNMALLTLNNFADHLSNFKVCFDTFTHTYQMLIHNRAAMKTTISFIGRHLWTVSMRREESCDRGFITRSLVLSSSKCQPLHWHGITLRSLRVGFVKFRCWSKVLARLHLPVVATPSKVPERRLSIGLQMIPRFVFLFLISCIVFIY